MSKYIKSRTYCTPLRSEKHRPVSCDMLRLDWINNDTTISCSEPRCELIRIIAKCPDKRIFGTDLIRSLNESIVSDYFPWLLLFVLLPYVLYFLTSVIYFTFYLPNNTFDSNMEDSPGVIYGCFVPMIFLLVWYIITCYLQLINDMAAFF